MLPKERLLHAIDELKARIRVVAVPDDPRLSLHRQRLAQYCGQVLLSTKGNRYATKVNAAIGQLLVNVDNPAEMLRVMGELKTKVEMDHHP